MIPSQSCLPGAITSLPDQVHGVGIVLTKGFELTLVEDQVVSAILYATAVSYEFLQRRPTASTSEILNCLGLNGYRLEKITGDYSFREVRSNWIIGALSNCHD